MPHKNNPADAYAVALKKKIRAKAADLDNKIAQHALASVVEEVPAHDTVVLNTIPKYRSALENALNGITDMGITGITELRPGRFQVTFTPGKH